MKTLISLADCAALPVSLLRGNGLRKDYTDSELESARAHMIDAGLKFNNKTGVTYRQGQWIARFSNPSDFSPHDSLEDIFIWAFGGEIGNCASRIKRGYSPY